MICSSGRPNNTLGPILTVALLWACWPWSALLLRADSPRRLTTDGKIKTGPVFIQHGRQLIYSVQETAQQFSLMRLDLDTGTTQRLHPAATTSEFGIAFSRDERWYAYIRNDGNLHVSVVIRDTRTETQASHNPGDGFAGIQELTMAPDGSNVVFAFPDRGFAQQLFSLTMDGKQRRTLTDSDGFDDCPRYSPDGQSLAFSSTRDGNFEIYRATAEGRQVIRLTEHRALDTRPAWSPDGRRIAFTSLRDGNYDIYIMDADGQNVRRLLDHPEREDYACWHPDGERLVFVGERQGKCDLYLVDDVERRTSNIERPTSKEEEKKQ